ncbi:SDR family oxidoreductase [Sinimarinibacterium flocculans]|uniref:SDR family oxidoreductase n=1 Tax=Sinimarinibacterium flocculans TaxID=985250 RepID=UPI002491E568|nr:SDR family oxidoreductase [Sinimarinibacterium flocculans]
MATTESLFQSGTFSGRNVFVAGGTSGINLAIARRFGELGARPFVISRSQERVDAAVAELATVASAAAGMAADVRDYAAVETALKTFHDAAGEIDIVVSGAAGNFVAEAAKLSSNGFRTVVDIDLVGTFHVCRAAFPMLRKPGASLINISATQAINPMPGQAHVCAAKAGIDALTKVLAIEWGPLGVRVNGIAPGPVEATEGMSRLTPTDAHRQAVLRAIPLRRYARLSEIADTAVFLCSPAGANFNGEILVCDGGQSTLGSGAFAAAWAGAG